MSSRGNKRSKRRAPLNTGRRGGKTSSGRQHPIPTGFDAPAGRLGGGVSGGSTKSFVARAYRSSDTQPTIVTRFSRLESPTFEPLRFIVKSSVIEEMKVPAMKGEEDKGKPIRLGDQPPIHLILSEEATLLRNAMRGLLGYGKIYRFALSTVLTVSSSAGGIVNAVSQNLTINSNTDFIALSAVFQEFFITSQHAHYMPVARYQYPLTGVIATSVANLPLGVASIQHATPAYTSLAAMTQNYAFALHSTGDPWSYTWGNPENPNSGVVVEAGTTPTLPSQGWANTLIGAANYTGEIQLLTNSAPPGLVASQKLADMHVRWNVLFRCRD